MRYFVSATKNSSIIKDIINRGVYSRKFPWALTALIKFSFFSSPRGIFDFRLVMAACTDRHKKKIKRIIVKIIDSFSSMGILLFSIKIRLYQFIISPLQSKNRPESFIFKFVITCTIFFADSLLD